jgi:hypothetical protein
VRIRQGFAETRQGILQAWLNAETTTLSVNGGPALDLSGDWTPPTRQSDASWAAFVSDDMGITLAAGQSLTFAFQIALSHPVPEVVGGSRPEVNPRGSQGIGTCTVTAA